MKVAIFAGGLGTRISEETTIRPKPMVEIGGQPILWHIMKLYAHYGLTDFVILGGYRINAIRDFFLRYRENSSDFRLNLKSGEIEWLGAPPEDWNVTVLDTGGETMTGGRLKRAAEHLRDGPFCLTYGDGVADVDIAALIEAHRASDKYCTLTAVTQPGRFGALHLSADLTNVEGFREKGPTDGGLINGGFFVCEPEVLDLVDDDQTVWEQEPMRRMVEMGKLGSFHHDGYWQSMDTLRDRHVLEEAWRRGAPWKVWS